jgi:hypothetical protein
MNDYIVGLRDRYRARGILVDTNLLLLFFIGLFDRGQISRFKRTKTYTGEDFDVLDRFLSQFARLITTPNILSEVSNLSGQLGEPVRSRCLGHFAKHFDSLVGKGLLAEEYVASGPTSSTLPIGHILYLQR